jgi:ferredoxin
MKVKIDEDACIGCELCTQISTSVFEMEGDKAKVTAEEVPEEENDNVQESVDSCPTDAIIIIEE